MRATRGLQIAVLLGVAWSASGPAAAQTPVPSPRPAPRMPAPQPALRGQSLARCTAGPARGPGPLNYRVGGGRVGGAVLAWWVEPNTEYVVERALDPGAGIGSRIWTQLTASCSLSSGMTHFMQLHEDGIHYPGIYLADVYPGIQLGLRYAYRVTAIRADGRSGSSEASYTTSAGYFLSGPIAAVNGNTVRLAADISYCSGATPPLRCDPWMMEFVVTSSSSGFRYSTRQPWVDSYDPHLPVTVPGGVEGTFVFTIPGVPSGTYRFTLTALYQPDHKTPAGSVTVVVP